MEVAPGFLGKVVGAEDEEVDGGVGAPFCNEALSGVFVGDVDVGEPLDVGLVHLGCCVSGCGIDSHAAFGILVCEGQAEAVIGADDQNVSHDFKIAKSKIGFWKRD